MKVTLNPTDIIRNWDTENKGIILKSEAEKLKELLVSKGIITEQEALLSNEL